MSELFVSEDVDQNVARWRQVAPEETTLTNFMIKRHAALRVPWRMDTYTTALQSVLTEMNTRTYGKHPLRTGTLWDPFTRVPMGCSVIVFIHRKGSYISPKLARSLLVVGVNVVDTTVVRLRLVMKGDGTLL